MKDNKIISFESNKKRLISKQRYNNNSKYVLKYKININIFLKGGQLTFNYYYPEDISEDEAFKIIYDIFLKTAHYAKKIKIPLEKLINQNFSLLYYSNTENPKDFKFISNPKLDNTILAAVLGIIINNS